MPFDRNSTRGKVVSIHLHPAKPGLPMCGVDSVRLVADRGIEGNSRYWNRQSSPGNPSKRQVTLIEREIIEEHAKTLKTDPFPPGAVRSNIETSGVALVQFLGHRVRIGQATLLFVEARTPCQKMNAVFPGLRNLMENGRQGVLAQVLDSGEIRAGDRIEVLRPVSQHL